MGKKTQVKRGYFVSRQRYALCEPCERAVEIAFSNDNHAPYEHSSAEMLQPVFKSAGEGETFRYPRDAVAAALRVRDAWLKHQPEAEGDGIKLTVTTGGGMFAPEAFADETEAIAWAEGRYNGRPPREKPKADPEAEAQWKDKLRKVRREFEAAEKAGYLKWNCEPEEEPYDDSWIDSDASICEEQREEEREELYRTLEREGVWFCYIGSPKFKEGHVCGCGSIVGDDESMEYALKDEALQWLANRLDKRYEKMARKLAKRATYAGPQP